MSIRAEELLDFLLQQGVEFFTGVPDSLLKDFCAAVDDRLPVERHVIAPNEGSAVALAAGYHLGTGTLPLVYMQNSGLGNAVNPLLSLCAPEVYAIPMLVMVGWRGEPGVKDEPQHLKQGQIQCDLLNAMGVPYCILSKTDNDPVYMISLGLRTALSKNQPFVLLLRKGVFTSEKRASGLPAPAFSREAALKVLVGQLDANAVVVATTGKASRELFEIRAHRREGHEQDFLTVGSMGHASAIALGIALAQPERSVYCVDGDGALLMHMGILPTIGKCRPRNFKHILINNGVHESVGGQATAINTVSLSEVVRGSGYRRCFHADSEEGLKHILNKFRQVDGPAFLEVVVQPGSRVDLGRPTVSTTANKAAFMDFLHDQVYECHVELR